MEEDTRKKYQGLTSEQVRERIAEGKQNQFQDESSRSVQDIVCSNVFTLFNFINIVLFVMVLSVFSFKNAAFMVIAVVNTVIGIIQELRAKKTLDDLRILTVNEVQAVRDGKTELQKVTELVQDDLIILTSGQQIPADGIVLEGRIEVNESLLTGESDSIVKEAGAQVLSGSFVTSGRAFCQITKVGRECYMERIAQEAKVFKKHPSQLRDSINKILKFISIIILPVGIGMFYKGYCVMELGYKSSVLDMVAAVVGMIPEGLVLLTSMALALGVMRLAKRKTLVQELYCIETLARVDTLCLDKTGTLTEGRLTVERIEPEEDAGDVKAAIVRLLAVLPDENETAKALKEKYPADADTPRPEGELAYTIPFSSDRKYSGASFYGEGTWYMGAYGFLFGAESAQMDTAAAERIAGYAKQGYRVLALAHTDAVLKEADLPSGLTLKALILLTDVIRPEAPEILEYFREQDVDIRIISGDDPDTVQAIAERAGLQTETAAVNALELTDTASMEEALRTAKVFGRVTPAQKEQMVELLQKQGHTVAMTGDGVNDVLALKKADCSIAMAAGSDAAKNVANLVLLDSNFASMPHIVNEGRRVINNIKRSSSMFLVKTIFSVLLAVMTIFLGQAYPFQPVQLSIISAFAVGIPSFLLQMEPSFERIKEGFLGDVFRNAVPTAFTIATLVFLMENIGLRVGYSEAELATACVLTTGFNYVLAQTRVYSPLTPYRSLIVYSMQGLFLLSIMFIGRQFLDLTDLKLELVVVVLMAVQISPLINRFYDILFCRFLQLKDMRTERRRAKEKRDAEREKKNRHRRQGSK